MSSLKYTNFENTGLIIPRTQTDETKTVVEGATTIRDLNQFATTDDLVTELTSIRNNVNAYGTLRGRLDTSSSQYHPKASADQNHPEYVPNVIETALMDANDHVEYQTTLVGISSVALIGVIVATIMFSSNRG